MHLKYHLRKKNIKLIDIYEPAMNLKAFSKNKNK